jgi:hyperosmotically inducible protein
MKSRLDTRFQTTMLVALLALAVVACTPTPASTAVSPSDTRALGLIKDKALATIIQSALLADPVVKNFNLDVDVSMGEIQLSGGVDEQAQVDRALQVARGIVGIQRINNKLIVKVTTTPTTVAAADIPVDDIGVTTKVMMAFLDDPDIRSFDIAVATSKGHVRLNGVVDFQRQIDQAIRLTRKIDGVQGIRDELSLKKLGTTPSPRSFSDEQIQVGGVLRAAM